MNPSTGLIVIALSLILSAVPGCRTTMPSRQEPKEPSSQGPLQERPIVHRYRYYPESGVYLDVPRRLFFYHNGVKWVSTTLLPVSIRVDWNAYRTLELDTDKPYLFHPEVVKRYPPDPKRGGETARPGTGRSSAPRATPRD